MYAATVVVFTLCSLAVCTAFVPTSSRVQSRIRLHEGKLAEDKERNEGYGPFGSLTRQGPVPFFIRLSNPEVYEQAVNKYMVLEKCDRKTAQGNTYEVKFIFFRYSHSTSRTLRTPLQGNMDAYFQDPNGWAGNKLRARKTGKDIDYANVNQSPKELGLTAVWAFGILSLFWRLFQVQVLEK
jgi:hypothetical protein